MSELSLSQPDWDLVFDDTGDLVFVEGAEETNQNSKFRLQVLRGEMFDDTRKGVPWLTDMVDPRVDVDTKKQIIRRTIFTTPGAASLEKLELGFDSATGKMAVNFSGTTVDGISFDSFAFPQKETQIDDSDYKGLDNPDLWFYESKLSNIVNNTIPEGWK